MRKKPTAFIALALAVPMLFSNCATILSPTSYPIYIQSDPKGATVTITDKQQKEIFKGTAPATVSLKSGGGYFAKAEYQVKLTLDGYDERILPVQFKLNGWYFGNIFLGGFIGMLIVDPATGAMWKLATPQIYAPMIESKMISPPVLQVKNLSDIPESERANLVKIK